MKRVSARRRKRDAVYPAARAAARDRADGRCEVHAVMACTGLAEQIHHIAGRGGPDPHRLENLLAVCHRCHQHIHLHPRESYDRGWMNRRTT